jgi:hypothetical protein
MSSPHNISMDSAQLVHRSQVVARSEKILLVHHLDFSDLDVQSLYLMAAKASHW